VRVESAHKRSSNTLAHSRWHVSRSFRCRAVGTAGNGRESISTFQTAKRETLRGQNFRLFDSGRPPGVVGIDVEHSSFPSNLSSIRLTSISISFRLDSSFALTTALYSSLSGWTLRCFISFHLRSPKHVAKGNAPSFWSTTRTLCQSP